MQETSESNQSLWLLTVSPSIWAAHFLASYLTAAIYCAKFAGPDGSLRNVRLAIAVYTILALGGIGVNGWIGYRRQAFGSYSSTSFDTSADRHRFLGFATLLLSGLSAVAVGFVALVAWYMEDCH